MERATSATRNTGTACLIGIALRLTTSAAPPRRRRPARRKINSRRGLARRVSPSHLRAGGKHQYVSLTDQHSNSHPNVRKSPNKFLKADVHAGHTTGGPRNEHRQDADRGRSESWLPHDPQATVSTGPAHCRQTVQTPPRQPPPTLPPNTGPRAGLGGASPWNE